MKQARRASPPEIDEAEEVVRRFGWLAVVVVLSIVGIAIWLVRSGND